MSEPPGCRSGAVEKLAKKPKRLQHFQEIRVSGELNPEKKTKTKTTKRGKGTVNSTGSAKNYKEGISHVSGHREPGGEKALKHSQKAGVRENKRDPTQAGFFFHEEEGEIKHL